MSEDSGTAFVVTGTRLFSFFCSRYQLKARQQICFWDLNEHLALYEPLP